jgi:hypothetical protein
MEKYLEEFLLRLCHELRSGGVGDYNPQLASHIERAFKRTQEEWVEHGLAFKELNPNG